MTNTTDKHHESDSSRATGAGSVSDAAAEQTPAEEIDTGEPIAELHSLTEMPSDGFLDRLMRKIDRVQLGGELTGFAWNAPWVVIREFLTAFFEALGGPSSGDRVSTADEQAERAVEDRSRPRDSKTS